MALFSDLEMPLLPVLIDMEMTGIQLDATWLVTLSEELTGRLSDLEKAIYEHAGTEFNINSTQQLSVVLFDTLGLPTRGYGYGASMGAWALDYAAHWGGDEAWIRHSAVRYVGPAYEGDLTYVEGTVAAKSAGEGPWRGTVDLELRMSNQDGAPVADGTVTIALPQ